MAFPHYTQLDQMDCGPTCLRMVSKHYGRLFSAQSLREKAQIGKEGVSLLGIAEAAESLGFHTMGVKVSFEKLAAEAPFPYIVHWDQNHFVVVHAITGASGNWMSRIRGGRTGPGKAVPEQMPVPPMHLFAIDEGGNCYSTGATPTAQLSLAQKGAASRNGSCRRSGARVADLFSR